jgi:hypothetical protein
LLTIRSLAVGQNVSDVLYVLTMPRALDSADLTFGIPFQLLTWVDILMNVRGGDAYLPVLSRKESGN